MTRTRMASIALAVAIVAAAAGARLHAFAPSWMTEGPTYQFSAGWTSVVPVLSPSGNYYTIFFYNKDNGQMAVIYLSSVQQ